MGVPFFAPITKEEAVEQYGYCTSIKDYHGLQVLAARLISQMQDDSDDSGEPEPDIDDNTDDAYAFASAGHGTDEDYGYFGE